MNEKETGENDLQERLMKHVVVITNERGRAAAKWAASDEWQVKNGGLDLPPLATSHWPLVR
jgi:hypothetical protein